jgi:hypothetical protein
MADALLSIVVLGVIALALIVDICATVMWLTRAPP